MKLFTLIDQVLGKVELDQLKTRQTQYERKKSIWNGIRWLFVAGVIISAFTALSSREYSNEVPILNLVIAGICLVISWIGYLKASKANIKKELLEMSVTLHGGSRKNFKKFFEDKGDDNLEAMAAEMLSGGLLEIFDEANKPEKINSYLKSKKFSYTARQFILKLFKEFKKMVTLVIEEFDVQLETSSSNVSEEIKDNLDINKKLEELKKLFNSELITEDEYNRKKSELLEKL